MYDMYPWADPDSAAGGTTPQTPPILGGPVPPDPPGGDPAAQTPLGGTRPPRPPLGGEPSPPTPLGGDPSLQAPLGGDPTPQAPRASLVRAVQVALDRRDNGGDAIAAASAPGASQPPASRTR